MCFLCLLWILWQTSSPGTLVPPWRSCTLCSGDTRGGERQRRALRTEGTRTGYVAVAHDHWLLYSSIYRILKWIERHSSIFSLMPIFFLFFADTQVKQSECTARQLTWTYCWCFDSGINISLYIYIYIYFCFCLISVLISVNYFNEVPNVLHDRFPVSDNNGPKLREREREK